MKLDHSNHFSNYNSCKSKSHIGLHIKCHLFRHIQHLPTFYTGLHARHMIYFSPLRAYYFVRIIIHHRICIPHFDQRYWLSKPSDVLAYVDSEKYFDPFWFPILSCVPIPLVSSLRHALSEFFAWAHEYCCWTCWNLLHKTDQEQEMQDFLKPALMVMELQLQSYDWE